MKEFELEPGEHVVKQVRKHWFVFLTELLPYAIMAVLPFAAPKLLMLAPPMAIYATFFDFTTPLARAAQLTMVGQNVTAGEEVEIIGLRPTAKTVITGIEMFTKSLDEGMAGANAWKKRAERRSY